MSHYPVTVCLTEGQITATTIENALDAALDPFDENTLVAPYREYEEGGPEEFWWVGSVRHDRNNHQALLAVGAEQLVRDRLADHHRPDYPLTDEMVQSAAARLQDHAAAEWAQGAEWADKLGEHPNWADVVRLYNECHHLHNAVALIDDQELDIERLHYDGETGRAYTWSQYNPRSKWDWYVIGGRWQRHFLAMPNVHRDQLVFGQPGSIGDNGRPRRDDDGALYCDGGPLGLLDFTTMRNRAAERELARYDRWMALVAKYGAPEPAERIFSLEEVGELTHDEAQRRYWDQPVIKAAQARPNALIGMFGNPPEEMFGTTREEFEERARWAAVPGYALVTTTGEWTAPGRMGWFGMSSEGPDEQAAFAIAATKYIDSLPPTAWVIQVDCHI
jgi:hypothetical protein